MEPEDGKINDRSDLVNIDHQSKTYKMKIIELYDIIEMGLQMNSKNSKLMTLNTLKQRLLRIILYFRSSLSLKN